MDSEFEAREGRVPAEAGRLGDPARSPGGARDRRLVVESEPRLRRGAITLTFHHDAVVLRPRLNSCRRPRSARPPLSAP